MRAVMEIQVFDYIVKIGIATFKSKPTYKEYYLEMDTGNSLIWLQCAGCTKRFKQTPKPFPKQNSSSFHPLVSNNRPWLYECSYTDGASTRGVLAQETFYLGTKNGSLAKMEKIKFGCGLQNDMQYGSYRNNKIAGIKGLGWEPSSLVNQLNHTFKGKFSYCLPVLSGKTSNTFLTLGDDDAAHDQRHGTGPINPKKTPLYRRNQTSAYYVELQGISLNKSRLNMIKPQVFGGGCVVDSGTPYSRIVRPAFNVQKVELDKYFSRSKDLKKINGDLGLELCYEFRSSGLGFGTYKLQEITFHFRDADFVMKAEAVFELMVVVTVIMTTVKVIL